jgi:Ser/Thr protein kinase RdoA (MazF antagonist)
MFRLDLSDGQKFIIKIVEPSAVAQSNEAEKAIAWLSARHVPVVATTDQYRFPTGEVLQKTPFLEGRRVGLGAEELFTFGVGVAQLHHALAKVPYKGRWTKNTVNRLQALEKTRQNVAKRGLEVGPDPQRLLTLVADEQLDFQKSRCCVQPLHGDLNPGNVLIVDEKPVFMDFEDTVHSVLSIDYEILFAIERFVLVHVKNDKEAVSLGREFLRGYASQENKKYTIRNIDPVNVLRSLALRSLMVLVNGELTGNSVSEREWKKFFYLEEMSRSRAEVISRIFED